MYKNYSCYLHLGVKCVLFTQFEICSEQKDMGVCLCMKVKYRALSALILR